MTTLPQPEPEPQKQPDPADCCRKCGRPIDVTKPAWIHPNGSASCEGCE